MNKYFYAIIFLICFSDKSLAQEVPANAKEQAKTVIYDFELTDKQFAAWKSVKNNWLGSDYEAIKSENKIKVNCKNCESFYVNVIVKINENGKLEYYKLIDGSKCGSEITKQLELRFMRNFFKFEYPPELRNVIFQTRLGDALKC